MAELLAMAENYCRGGTGAGCGVCGVCGVCGSGGGAVVSNILARGILVMSLRLQRQTRGDFAREQRASKGDAVATDISACNDFMHTTPSEAHCTVHSVRGTIAKTAMPQTTRVRAAGEKHPRQRLSSSLPTSGSDVHPLQWHLFPPQTMRCGRTNSRQYWPPLTQ
jgi:hypothetical protein